MKAEEISYICHKATQVGEEEISIILIHQLVAAETEAAEPVQATRKQTKNS
jgi:hypothetical protein